MLYKSAIDQSTVHDRPLSHGLGHVVAGLRSLWLASRLKPRLKATRGLRQLMVASHGLQHHGDLVQTAG